MYTPPLFREDDPAVCRLIMQEAPLATVVTMTTEGLIASPLPLYLEESEGPHGTLYGHLARANPQCHLPAEGEALAIFQGPNTYITPSWYPSKQEHGRVLPTWNYAAVHAYGRAEFFDDEEGLLHVISHLTDLQEKKNAAPWAVADAPARFVAAHLRNIVGMKIVISRLEGKRKMSQNRSEADRAGVVAALAASDCPREQAVSRMMPEKPPGK